ncbi:MAG: ribosome-binding ATPase [Thermoproteota archaeon]|nr:ribosome-binding ATPase [Thermoproteota archaeon]
MLVGVVGKTNTGKSTFFCAVTLIPVVIENRPFTTIKANRGIGYLRSPCVCGDFNVKDTPSNSICIDGIRLIPIELLDIAGLVPGAWQGKGLGNMFLDDIRKADALIHVVDAAGATDEEGQSSKPGTRDPVKDVEFLDYEISMWLVQIVKKDWRKLVQVVDVMKGNFVDALTDRLSGLSIKKAHVSEALRRTGLEVEHVSKWTDNDLLNLISTLRKIAKPMVIAANKIDLPFAEENVKRLRELGYPVVPCCCEGELILRRAVERGLISYTPGDKDFIYKSTSITDEQKRVLEIIRSKVLFKWGSTGVQQVMDTAFFKLLQMMPVYPVEDIEALADHKGRVLPDVFLIPQGSNPRQLAYLIHSDLGDTFIYAVDARTKKRLGEDYVLKERDVIKIISAKART